MAHTPLQYFTNLMNKLTCFIIFGGIIFTMAFTFLFISRIPFRVTQKPRYSISVFPNDNSLMLHLSKLYLSFCSGSSDFFKLSDQSPLVIINRLSMNYGIHSNPQNILFIFFWKISVELLTPNGSRLLRYFTHGRIIVHRFLASQLRCM